MPDSSNLPCLATSGLSHRYKGGASLHAIALSVPTGSIYGLLGPNGAGKTTTLRLVLGLIRQQQGTISIFGHSGHPPPGNPEARGSADRKPVAL